MQISLFVVGKIPVTMTKGRTFISCVFPFWPFGNGQQNRLLKGSIKGDPWKWGLQTKLVQFCNQLNWDITYKDECCIFKIINFCLTYQYLFINLGFKWFLVHSWNQSCDQCSVTISWQGKCFFLLQIFYLLYIYSSSSHRFSMIFSPFIQSRFQGPV